MTIAESLKRFRKTFGLSQKDVADKLGIKQPSYQVYESKVKPSAAVIVKLSQEFNVSADYLLGLSDTPNPENKVASIDNVDTDALALAAEHDGIKNYHENLANVLAKQGIKI